MPKDQQFLSFLVDADLLAALDEFRWRHRFATRAEAIRRLIRWALESKEFSMVDCFITVQRSEALQGSPEEFTLTFCAGTEGAAVVRTYLGEPAVTRALQRIGITQDSIERALEETKQSGRAVLPPVRLSKDMVERLGQ